MTKVYLDAMVPLLGLLSAVLAVGVASLSPKFIVATLGGIGLLLGTATMRRLGRILVLSFLMVFFIPVNLDVNVFLVRHHVGGAASISFSLAWITAMALLVIHLAAVARGEGRLVGGKEVMPLFLYAVCGLLSLLNAEHRNLVFLEVIRLVMMACVTLAVVNLSERYVLRHVLLFLTIAVLFQSSLTIVQFTVHTFPSMEIVGIKTLKELFPGQRVHRAMGTLGHPNFLGYYLEMTLPVIFGVFLTTMHRGMKILSGIAWVVGTAALVCSKSRGAWVGYPLAISGVLLLTFGRDLLRKGVFVRVVVGAFVMASCIVAFSPTIKDRLVGKDYRALAVRMPLNEAALSIVAQFPIVGVGMNNFSEVFKKYDTTGHSRIFRGVKHVVHNLYLLVMTETGTLGLVAFLGVFAVPLVWAGRALLRLDDVRDRAVVGGVAMGLTAHLIHGFVDPGFLVSPPASLTVFFLIGFLGAYLRYGHGGGYERGK